MVPAVINKEGFSSDGYPKASPPEKSGEALRQMESHESAQELLRQEAASGFAQLDCGDSIEMDRDAFMNHSRNRRQAA